MANYSVVETINIINTYVSNPNEIDLSFFKDPKKERIIDIKGGLMHSLILSNIGKVYSCGNGTSGDLGQSIKTKISKEFAEIYYPESDGRIIQISTGLIQSHSLLLSENFKVYAFGSNFCGQLGLNHTTSQFSPTL